MLSCWIGVGYILGPLSAVFLPILVGMVIYHIPNVSLIIKLFIIIYIRQKSPHMSNTLASTLTEIKRLFTIGNKCFRFVHSFWALIFFVLWNPAEGGYIRAPNGLTIGTAGNSFLHPYWWRICHNRWWIQFSIGTDGQYLFTDGELPYHRYRRYQRSERTVFL